MRKSKKIKIFLGLFYLILIASFLFVIFSKFELDELTSYKFIQQNREYFFELKQSNIILLSIIFIFFSMVWVFLLGFGTPVALLGGFIFGKWFGTLIVALGLTLGATFLYIFGNFFLKKFIKEKFLHKYKNLEKRFKKNELMFFIFFRFVGVIPFQIANLLPVLFNVSIKNYFFGTILGIIGPLFIYVSLGSGIENIIEKNVTTPSIVDLLSSRELYIPVIAIITLIIITFVFKKLFYKE